MDELTLVTEISETKTDTIFVIINGEEFQTPLENIGLTFESSNDELMSKIIEIVKETYDTDITDLYKINKAVTNRNIFVIPNSTAGM